MQFFNIRYLIDFIVNVIIFQYNLCKMTDKKKNVCIVVLGDIGRSPRMQYHALSLAEVGHRVDIIGYGQTDPMEEIKKSPFLYYHYLIPPPVIPQRILNYIVKTIWAAINLLFLIIICKPNVLLVQNPPAIPTLIISWIYSRIVGCKFIIDWHNYAHTIMALNLNRDHTLVKITKKVESFIGRKSDYNFCVTNAMKNDLFKNWNISATTLYDKPPEMFKSISLQEKYTFLLALGKQYKQLVNEDGSSIFIDKVENEYYLKKNRPGLLVSSTSWTEDEDFAILFSALQGYEIHILNGNQRKLPRLICVITGKGPLKEYYCKKIQEQNWQNICVITPWLESKQYPLILASADLGVSLHTSSSGLDLPMKVVDMFGCGLPVCAYDFNCLNELVQDGKNSYKFNSSNELSELLQNWFENFDNNEKQKEIEIRFKKELQSFQNLRWKENWYKVASSVFN